MTSLVAKGLALDGHNCLGMMVIGEDRKITYEGRNVDDVYAFLKGKDVDIVINQLAMDVWLLETFLSNGGQRWHDEGGKIISCLHFDSKQTSTLYYFKSKRDKSFKDYLWIAKAWLLYRYYDRLQAEKAGEAYRWIYENSDWYVTLSESHNPYLKKVIGLSDYKKLVVINNPLTFDDISSPEILDSKKKVVLICARMNEYQKRILLALKAWKRLRRHKYSEGWVLKIVGTGPDLDYYKRYVEVHHIDNVFFEGRRNPEPYYEEASIFLMTSGNEGWGLTLTESLQRGVVPVVMNTSNVFGDIIQHAYNGYLTEGSSLKDFVRHIKILMCDEERLRTMQVNALDSSRRFSLDKTMTKWRCIIPPAESYKK